MRVSARTYILGFGTFAVGTSAYGMAALVPDVAVKLSVSVAQAGQLVTVFAFACALSGPILMTLTQRVDRVTVLGFALGMVGLGNALSGTFESFEMVAAGRVLAAMGTAVFTPLAVGVAASMNHARLRGRAMSVAFGGLTVAMLVGVPAVRQIGESLGVQYVLATFTFVGLLCSLLTFAVMRLPSPALPPPATVRERLTSVSSVPVLMVLAVMLIAVASNFVLFTYLAPVIVVGVGSVTAVAPLLAMYGLGAVAGNVVGGWAADRFGPRVTLVTGLQVCMAVLFAVPEMLTSMRSGAFVLALWGAAFWSINAPITSWLAELAPESTALVLSVNGSAIYAGMGLGAAVGGAVVSRWSVADLAWTAALMALLAASVAICVPSKTRPGKQLTNPRESG